MYTLRAAGPDDLPAMRELDLVFESHLHAADVLRRAITEGKIVLAESAQEGVVGYVRWDYFWDTIPFCLTARVKPEHRRRGLGRRLYEHIEASFRQRGCAFWLSSTEETNEVSQRFHESLDFRPIGKLVDLGQDVPEIFYRKDIR
jgi:ribosomal protein S18 acetylase RimI-like enzyme